MLFAAPLPSFQTERLLIREIKDSDVDSLFRIFSDPAVVRYWSSPAMQDREEAQQLYELIRECLAAQTLFQFGVQLHTSPEIIGTITLYNIDMQNRRAELGYALGSSWWKNGYMTEALHKMLSYCFKELNLNRIEADVDPRNEESIKSLERMKFQREGFLRQRWIVNEEVQDALFYGLLREDFLR
jgi:[ribosomal protein S5]-alanine N-acetyltransferase